MQSKRVQKVPPGLVVENGAALGLLPLSGSWVAVLQGELQGLPVPQSDVGVPGLSAQAAWTVAIRPATQALRCGPHWAGGRTSGSSEEERERLQLPGSFL